MVLLPSGLAGRGVSVHATAGRIETQFPDRIAPYQPLRGVLGLDWQTADGIDIKMRFNEAPMEMEDQRNWGDASFKLYHPPISDPSPLRFRTGQRVRQRVDVETDLTAPRRAGKPARRNHDVVEVAVQASAPMPALGLSLPIRAADLNPTVEAWIRRLAPSYLRAVVDLRDPGWRAKFESAGRAAAAVSCPTELELIAIRPALPAFVDALAESSLQCERVLVFPANGYTTERADLTTLRRLLSNTGLAGLVGGGSRAAFAELNETVLPLDLMDVAGYPISPQVHADDEASMVETLDVLATMVRDARLLVGDIPLTIGPVTLKPRLNTATGQPPRPQVGTLPGDIDPRQASPFLAAWTVGAVSQLAASGPRAITLFDTHGMAGVMLDPSSTPHPDFESPAVPVFPVYHVLAELMAVRSAGVCPATGPKGVAVLAVRDQDRISVLISELCGRRRNIRLRIPGWKPAAVRAIQPGTMPAAPRRLEVSARQVRQPFTSVDQSGRFWLEPHAVVRVDGRIDI